MFVEVDLSRPDAEPLLREPQDLKSLKVVAIEGSGSLEQALASVGTLTDDGADVMLRIDALRALAGPLGSDPDWTEGFDAMIGYARSKGWVRGDGTVVQAHLETDTEEP